MTAKNKKQLEYIMATHAVERLIPSKAALRLCGQMSDGKLNANDAVEALLHQYGLMRVSSDG